MSAIDDRPHYDQNTSLLSRLQTATAAKPKVPAISSPDQAAKTATAATATAATQAPAQPSTYADVYDQVKKSTGLEDILNAIKSALTGQPKKADLYNEELAKTSVTANQSALKTLDDRLAGIDTALNQSDKDIRDRISNSGGLVTESQVQRLVAQEKAPLISEYSTLANSRKTLAERIAQAEADASKMADLRYSDASQPYETAKAQLDLVNPVFNDTLSVAEKDLQTRLNGQTTATKAADKVKTDVAAQDKTMAAKGYQYVSTPAHRDLFKRQGYDIFELNGRTYAKQSATSLYAAKKAIEASYKTVKAKTTTPKKSPTSKKKSTSKAPKVTKITTPKGREL